VTVHAWGAPRPRRVGAPGRRVRARGMRSPGPAASRRSAGSLDRPRDGGRRRGGEPRPQPHLVREPRGHLASSSTGSRTWPRCTASSRSVPGRRSSSARLRTLCAHLRADGLEAADAIIARGTGRDARRHPPHVSRTIPGERVSVSFTTDRHRGVPRRSATEVLERLGHRPGGAVGRLRRRVTARGPGPLLDAAALIEADVQSCPAQVRRIPRSSRTEVIAKGRGPSVVGPPRARQSRRCCCRPTDPGLEPCDGSSSARRSTSRWES